MNKFLIIFFICVNLSTYSQTWVQATPFPDATGALNTIYPLPESYISSLVEYNGDLYVGGNFTAIGGIVAHGIAKWDGNTWNSVGPGNLLEHAVTDICIYNGGLYFTAEKLYKWNGTSVELVTYPYYDASQDSTFYYSIEGTDLHAFNNDLYIVPYNDVIATAYLPKYDGTTLNYIPFNANQTGQPRVIDDFNNSIYMGAEKGLYRLESNSWVNCNGITTADPYIVDIETYNNELIVLGNFSSIGGITVNNIAKYNGTNWFNIDLPGSSIPQTLFYMKGNLGTNHLRTIGNTLYLAHSFSQNNSFTPARKYNGTQWSGVANNHSNYYGGGAVIIYNNYLYCGGSMNLLSWGNTLLGNFVRLSTTVAGIENGESDEIIISPNPTSDKLHITLPQSLNGVAFEIADQFGKIILTGKLNAKENEINLESVSKGIYFLKIDGFEKVERVVKN